MTASEILVYVLVGVFAVMVMAAGVVLRKTMQLRYQAVSTNRTLFNAILIIGLGVMLCIPEKSSVWVLAAFMFVLLIMILKRFRDGVDEKGVCLAGRFHPYGQYEAYSMRRREPVTEFRFYRPGSIRMMSFSDRDSEEVERFIASQGMKKKEFQEIRVKVG